jgi:hypothetical protein
VIALIGLAGGDLDIEDDAEAIIDRRVLLVSWLEPPVPGVGRHRGVRVGEADLLVSTGLLAVALGPLPRRVLSARRRRATRLVILRHHRVCMPLAEALPGDVGADERRVDVDEFPLGDAGPDAGPHRPGEDLPEQLGASALADASE